MTTEAKTGYDTLFQKRTSTGPDVWTTLAEVTNVTPPGLSRDTHDASHTQSPNSYREFISGMIDGGEVTLEINFVPGSATTALLLADLDLPTAGTYRVVFPDDETWTFSALMTGLESEAPIDDKMTATATYKVSGKPTLAAAVAPVNSILPAISGIAQVGQTLTAYPGNWSGAPTFTYAWKNEGVAIGGATASTYVPVVGDVGANITVTVTATNAAGNASATSAETTAVLAA